MAHSSRQLGDLRAPELPSALTRDSIIVLPLGAIEQHGPHLPLNTDFVVADAVANAAVKEFGEETQAWILPTLPFTKSNEHAWSGGTMWLSAQTMMSVLGGELLGVDVLAPSKFKPPFSPYKFIAEPSFRRSSVQPRKFKGLSSSFTFITDRVRSSLSKNSIGTGANTVAG